MRFKNSGFEVIAKHLQNIRSYVAIGQRIFGRRLDLARAEIRRHDETVFLKSTTASLRIRQASIVEDLQQHVENIRMRFSISSKRTTEYGRRRTASVSCPPSS
jgi:hypothetical protein